MQADDFVYLCVKIVRICGFDRVVFAAVDARRTGADTRSIKA